MQSVSSSVGALSVRLAQVMAHVGVSQTELARRIDVSPSFIGDVLRGIKKPGADVLARLRDTFGVSVDWLLSGEGAMIGGGGIRHDLFRIILLQTAVARAAVIDEDATAQALLVSLQEGQMAAVTKEPLFKELIDRLMPKDGEVDLAVALYNGCQGNNNPVDFLAIAVTHFEARKPFDGLKALAASSAKPASVKIINKGKKSKFAGRDFHEAPKTK